MPQNNTDATESAPKKPLVFLLVVAVCLLLAVAARILVTDPQVTTVIGSQTYNLEIADTNAERSKGLSGRDSLEPQSGMLFMFNENDAHCFWMKDTHVTLDMIWLNDQKRVTRIYENVAPETYPQSFCSDESGRYGVELPAGSVQKNGLHVGDYIEL